MSDKLRFTILSELAKQTGKVVSWKFIKQTNAFLPGIDRFHNLVTGIYKPAWSDYALSIVMKPSSPYENKDEVIFLEDGRWLMNYSPRSGGLGISDNRALVKCLDDHIPLAVFQQLTDKNDRVHGSTYRVLGLGLITDYDRRLDVFCVEGVDQIGLEQVTGVIQDEEVRYEVQLYAQLTNEFRPFVKEEKVPYNGNFQKRDNAFRKVVLGEYDYKCSVCGMKFCAGSLIEAQAAHIVPKQVNGTDDPRNGISLCHTHHWAFDAGIFTICDDHTVALSPIIDRAEVKNFNLIEKSGQKIFLPESNNLYPHSLALHWHKENIWVKI